MSITTKQASPALAALSKAKGQRSTQTIATVKPAVLVVENKSGTEVIATPAAEPITVTPAVQPNEPSDGRDYKQSWIELKAHHDKTIYEERQRVKKLEEDLAKANQPKFDLPKTKEQVLAWKAQFPDAYDFMTTIAMQTTDNRYKEITDKLDQVNKASAELKSKGAMADLLKIHPDAMEIRDSAKFAEWFNDQPEDIKQILAKSTDIKAVAKQLTLYKLEVLGINPLDKPKAANSKERVDASLGVDVAARTEIAPQKKMWTKSEIDATTANYNTWLKYKDEIDLARRENRVDYTK